MLQTFKPPRIPPPLARRIDRLARRAHAFHRFAHHPLCDRYQSELIQLGHRSRICRGCTAALVGSALGAAAGWLSRSVDLAQATWLLPAFAIALAVAPLGRSKLLRRFLPAFLLAASTFHGPFAVTAFSILVAAASLTLYRRAGPNRSPCTTCPERTFEVCRGFAPIVRREQAFRRLSGRLLSRAGR